MPFPWLAGQRITAERLNMHNPVYVEKTAPTDRTSTTTITADPELVATLTEGLYQIVVEFGYGATSGPNGIRTAWVTTGDVTQVGLRYTRGTGASATQRNSDDARNTANNLSTEAVYGLALANLTQRGWGTEQCRVQVGAGGGTVAFGWAQAVSHADPTQVGPESYMRVERIG